MLFAVIGQEAFSKKAVIYVWTKHFICSIHMMIYYYGTNELKEFYQQTLNVECDLPAQQQPKNIWLENLFSLILFLSLYKECF